jgi:hypothetical protein
MWLMDQPKGKTVNLDKPTLVGLAALHDGFLGESGWFETFGQGLSIKKNGEPLPWFSYAAIFFLEPRLKKIMRVFEYGCGQSTLWWAHRVAIVHACEHDAKWFDLMRARIPANVDLRSVAFEENGAYCRNIAEFNNRFNIVVIDGRDRVNCAKNCLEALTRDGIIIWDDAEREKYREGYDFLAANCFKRIDFASLAPGKTYQQSTAIFYRADNCLGI